MSAVSPPQPEGLPSAAEERYRSGDVIGGKYLLVRPLGQGGFGRVWVALNQVLEVHVALKLIELDPDELENQAERLLEEARSAARLAHPAIVRVFDFGLTDARDPFVVMELLHGESLFERVRRETRLSASYAVQLVLPIADGLAAAHGKGIIHRDVKPENIFLAQDEAGRTRPKLLDFGIARRIDVDRKLTAKGSVVGTPDYMSPEQARGQTDVDERADVWSFCVLLYELITGQAPFGGPNYNALLWAIIEGQPVPITERAAGDEELWRIIEKGLKKLPDERWPSMRALGEALAGWALTHGVTEDICGTSVRAAWIDAPGASSEQPVSSNLSATLSPPRSPTLSASTADTRPPPKHRRAGRVALAALALGVVLAGAYVAIRGIGGAAAVSNIDTESSRAALGAGPAAVATPNPSPEPAAPPTASAPEPLPSASSAVEDAGSPRPLRAAPASRPRKRTKPVDFGF